MNRRWVSLVIVLLLGIHSAPARALPAEPQIRAILEERIDEYKKSVGIVVGVVDADGRVVVGHGRLSAADDRVPDGKTVFEIGSVSKVFTAIALAGMIESGEVKLDDPVSGLLPDSVRMPTRGEQQVTLRHLTTHTSGLPRMPGNFSPADPGNPFADYSVERLYAFLSGYELTRDIGARAEYSNLGVGLLGHALALRAGTDYETLIRKRVTGPLGMKDTSVTLGKKQLERLATGHDAALNAVSNWDIPTLAGAGALRSTADDMLDFLAANLGLKKSKISSALFRTQQAQEPFGAENLNIGMGWILQKGHDTEITWHNGGTGGYHSFAGFDKSKQIGVVVLSNSTGDIDDIGLHLLNSGYELAELELPPAVAAIDSAVFDAYVGRYQLAPSFILDVTRDGDRFYVQATGQGRIEVLPESDTVFFSEAVGAKVSFVAGDDGEISHLILHQGGANQKAMRMAADGTVKLDAPTEIEVSAEVLERYVGRYELAPGFILTLTHEDGRLSAQATGQQALEIFAKSENEFFYKAVDAQITFNVNEAGAVESLTLHQGGRDVPATRIE